jgi:hypothetical protein
MLVKLRALRDVLVPWRLRRGEYLVANPDTGEGAA